MGVQPSIKTGAVGDFSTWINRKVEWKAFGVLFDLEGVLAMIPAERRGRHKLSLSVAGDPAWLTAKQARQHVAEWGGVAGLKAGNVLIDNCRYGFVSAGPCSCNVPMPGEPGEWSHEECEWDVPTWFWSNFIDLEALEDWDDWHEFTA